MLVFHLQRIQLNFSQCLRKVGHRTRFFYAVEEGSGQWDKENMLTQKEQSLLDIIEPQAAAHGIEVVTLEVTGARKSPTVRIYIDTEDGVTFNELTEAQSWIGDLMDEIDPFPGAYMLEVSSPGIDRPLRTHDHFMAAVGQKVKLKTVCAIDGRKHFTGTLRSADGQVLVVDTEGGSVEVPLQDIGKANIIGTVEF